MQKHQEKNDEHFNTNVCVIFKRRSLRLVRLISYSPFVDGQPYRLFASSKVPCNNKKKNEQKNLVKCKLKMLKRKHNGINNNIITYFVCYFVVAYWNKNNATVIRRRNQFSNGYIYIYLYVIIFNYTNFVGVIL